MPADLRSLFPPEEDEFVSGPTLVPALMGTHDEPDDDVTDPSGIAPIVDDSPLRDLPPLRELPPLRDLPPLRAVRTSDGLRPAPAPRELDMTPRTTWWSRVVSFFSGANPGPNRAQRRADTAPASPALPTALPSAAARSERRSADPAFAVERPFEVDRTVARGEPPERRPLERPAARVDSAERRGSEPAAAERTSAPVDVAPPEAARDLFVERPAPWEGAECASHASPADTSARLVERLYELRESAPSRNDWLFIDRLVRTCSAPRLDFPLFPAGALRLDRLLRAGDTPQARVVEVVMQEPGLVQRVWQEAHSIAYGTTPPSNVKEAILRLGHRRLWQISMTACMNSRVFQARSHQPRANHLREVSIVAAEVSTVFSTGADAYLPALLHGLGTLVVFRAGPGRTADETATPEFVTQVADLVYPSVGLLLAHAWNLGPAVSAAIGFAPMPERAPAAYQAVARATRASSIAAHEAWALRQARTYDGLRALTGMSFPGPVVVRGLEAAEAAWQKVPPPGKG